MKLQQACIDLQIEPLDSEELAFLKQYRNILSLVRSCLDIVEGDKHYFGIYLPTLLGLNYKLNELVNTLNSTSARKFSINYTDENGDPAVVSSNCLPLVNAIKNGFEKRFGFLIDLFNADGKSIPLYLAMMSHPKYKLNFTTRKTIPTSLLNHLKNMLVTAAYETLGAEERIESNAGNHKNY